MTGRPTAYAIQRAGRIIAGPIKLRRDATIERDRLARQIVDARGGNLVDARRSMTVIKLYGAAQERSAAGVVQARLDAGISPIG